MKTSARSSASGPSRHAPAGITRPQPSPRSSGRRRTISRSRRTFTCWNPASSTNKSGAQPFLCPAPRASAVRVHHHRSGRVLKRQHERFVPASPGVRDGDTCNGNSGGCALYPRDSTTARRPRASLQPSSQSTTGVLPVPPHAMFPTETHWHTGRNAGEPSSSHFALRAASIRRYSNETGVSRGLSRFCQLNGFMAFLLRGGEEEKEEDWGRGRTFLEKGSPPSPNPIPHSQDFRLYRIPFLSFSDCGEKS